MLCETSSIRAEYIGGNTARPNERVGMGKPALANEWRPMLFKTKHLELELGNFVFVRAPWLGSVYIGPDSGCGYIVRSRPKEIDTMRRDYIERTRQTLRTRCGQGQ